MRTVKKTCSKQTACQNYLQCVGPFVLIAFGESLITILLSINCGSHVYHNPWNWMPTSNGKFEFYFALQLSHKLYALTDNLSKTFQSHKMSALLGRRNAELSKKTIEAMCNDESFVLLYETTVRKAEKRDFIQEPSLSRKRKEPN